MNVGDSIAGAVSMHSEAASIPSESTREKKANARAWGRKKKILATLFMGAIISVLVVAIAPIGTA